MALVFEVQVNDDAPVRAGGDQIAVLTAVLSHVRSQGETELTVGGLHVSDAGRKEQVEWLQRPLAVGDRIAIAIVDAAVADPPVRSKVENPTWAEDREREYYEQLKARFGSD